jgi:hypothetical protein
MMERRDESRLRRGASLNKNKFMHGSFHAGHCYIDSRITLAGAKSNKSRPLVYAHGLP